MDVSGQTGLLLNCLRAEQSIDLADLANLNEETWQKLLELARRQHVQFFLYEKFNNLGINKYLPSNLWQQLKNDYQQSTIRNLRLKAELINLLKSMQKNNIPVLLLKGLHLLNFVYPQQGSRFMRDLDVMVPLTKMREAFETAREDGYESDKKLQEIDFDFKYHHHLHKMVKNNVILELHASIFEPAPDKPISKQTMAKIWDNAVKTSIGKYEVWILSPVDLLLHLCIHISYQDNFTMDLRHYYDLFVVIKYYEKNFPWKTFLKELNNYKFAKGAYLVLKITEKLFKLKLPDVIEQLVSEAERKESEALIGNAIAIMWRYHKDPENMENYRKYKYRTSFKHYQEFYQGNFSQKMKTLREKIFLPKDKIAFEYGLSDKNPLLYLFYFVKFRDLLVSNTGVIFKKDDDSESFQEHVNQVNQLHNWLNTKKI